VSWTLRVFAPGTGPWNASPTAQYTHTSPGGIVGGFRWSLDGDGDCVQMEFEAVPKLVDIPPRANVQLLVGGAPVWFGTVVRTGAPGSGRSWRYVALGGRHMLKYAYANYTYNEPNTPLDIATLAANAWNTVQDKPLNPTMSTRATGYTLTRLTAQWVDTHTLLSDLARAAGDVPWGVDASGQVFFNKLPTSSRVSASQVDIDPLPVDADDVWGSVILYHPQSGYAYRYVGDARYGERVVVVPNLLDYMALVQGSYGYRSTQLYQITSAGKSLTTTINSQLLQDGDSNTGYNLYKPSAPAGSICTPSLSSVGISFTPSTWPEGGIVIHTDIRVGRPDGGPFVTPYRPTLVAGDGSPGAIITGYDISSLDGRQYTAYYVPSPLPANLWVALDVPDNCHGYDLYVYEFSVLSPTSRLQSLAQSLLQPPYLTPQDIRITGYVAPANYLHVDGLGTFEIDTWEYEYTMERGLLTTARVGRRGSEHQQSQRIAITGLSREWAERLRLSIGRTT
jgi:hypothetical protein